MRRATKYFHGNRQTNDGMGPNSFGYLAQAADFNPVEEAQFLRTKTQKPEVTKFVEIRIGRLGRRINILAAYFASVRVPDRMAAVKSAE